MKTACEMNSFNAFLDSWNKRVAKANWIKVFIYISSLKMPLNQHRIIYNFLSSILNKINIKVDSLLNTPSRGKISHFSCLHVIGDDYRFKNCSLINDLIGFQENNCQSQELESLQNIHWSNLIWWSSHPWRRLFFRRLIVVKIVEVHRRLGAAAHEQEIVVLQLWLCQVGLTGWAVYLG